VKTLDSYDVTNLDATNNGLSPRVNAVFDARLTEDNFCMTTL
jgi:hypothetical protein